MFTMNEVDQNNFSSTYSCRALNLKRSWTLYNSAGSDEKLDKNDAVLVRDEDKGAWSTYDLSLSCLGNGGTARDWALSDFTGDYDWDFTHFADEDFLSFNVQKDSNIFLGGDYDGMIYMLEYGSSDDTSTELDLPIPMSLLSAGLNPYKDRGIEAQLGYVDLYCDRSVQGKLLISFYQDDSSSASHWEYINLIPEVGFCADIYDIDLTDPLVCIIRSASHGLRTGAVVFFYGIDGTTQLNTGPFTVTNIDEDSFSLDGVNTAGYTAYAGGGLIVDTPVDDSEERVWKRAYCGAIGYQHRIQIDTIGANQNVGIHAIKPWFREVGSRQLS
jgi:hypothetical protein